FSYYFYILLYSYIFPFSSIITYSFRSIKHLISSLFILSPTLYLFSSPLKSTNIPGYLYFFKTPSLMITSDFLIFVLSKLFFLLDIFVLFFYFFFDLTCLTH